MAFDPLDPKWTAYVLGELDDTERRDVESELAESADARQFVDEIRRAVELVAAELEAEPMPGTTEVDPAPVGVANGALPEELRDDGPSSDRKLFHAIRPEGHAPAVRAWVALAAAVLAMISMGTYLVTMPLRGLREISRANPVQVVDDSNSQTAEELDSTDERAPVGGLELQNHHDAYPRYPSSDLEIPVNAPQQAAGDAGGGQKPNSPEPRSLTITVNKSAGEQREPKADYRIAKPVYETKTKDSAGKEAGQSSSENDGITVQLPAAKRVVVKPMFSQIGGVTTFRRGTNEGTDSGDRSREEGRGEVDTLNKGQAASLPPVDDPYGAPAAAVPFPADEPIAYPDAEVWQELTVRRKKWREFNAEAYDDVTDNPFFKVADNPLSTFSIDVDTASYSIVRRFLLQNHQRPPRSAVRIEELVNYFHYDYPPPADGKPFAASVEVAGCPWNGEHRLVRVGLKGAEVPRDRRPLSNLVFLVDVSGSMQAPNKLPLVKESLRLLTEQLGENDRVAIVVYAGSSGLVLPSTSGSDKPAILRALDTLQAGGSTNGAQGIQLAYETALTHFIKGGTNRVILATDGDFNVGVTDRGELIKLITDKAASGVFLTTLGYGMGNLKDATLEQLADKGNGNYAYIDDVREAKKVLVEQLSGTLVTIAKDVKIQIEFNPAQVASFRLIGYENRILQHEDFNNDKKDAGDIGAGHTVTALYELAPAGKPEAAPTEGAQAAVDPLKYQQQNTPTGAAQSGELLTLKLRYKQPDGDKSELLEFPVKDSGGAYARASQDFKFAASVALFGMLLRDSPYKGTATFDAALELAQEGRGSDLEGYRGEFIELIRAASGMK